MAQRRPHGQQNTIDPGDSRAIWREQVLEGDPKGKDISEDTKRMENRSSGKVPESSQPQSISEEKLRRLMFDSQDEQQPQQQRKTGSQSPQRRPAQQQRRPSQKDSQSGRRPAQAGSQSGRRPAQANNQSSRRPAQAGSQSGQRPAQANNQSSRRPAQAGSQSGRRPAQANSQSGRRPAQAGSQSGRRPAQGQNRKTAAASRQQTVRKSDNNLKKQRKAKDQKKVFSKSFKKGFFIAWAAFAVTLIVTLVILWSSLNRYESGLPEHYMNQIVQDISNGKLSELHLATAEDVSIDDPSLFADTELVQTYLQNKGKETPLSYVKVNAESSEEENVFLIRSGDDRLLKIFLSKDTENGKEKAGWHETKTQMIADDLAVSSLTAQIPSASTLLVGNREVPKSFVTESGAQVQLLENLINQGIIGPQPTVDTYTVQGIFPQAAVTERDEAGNVKECTLVGQVYTAGFEADEAFAAEQTARVMSLFEPYAKYFSGDAGREALNAVMLNGSPAYTSASSADVSWMQEHDGISLSDESVTNIKKYSDDVYSCDIRFVQDILRGGESVRTWDTNMTWIMVRDGDYYLADLVTRTSDN